MVVQGPASEILATCLRLDIKKYNPQVLWKKFVELIRLALWVRNGVELNDARINASLKNSALSLSYEKLIALFELCYTYELSFAKTAEPGSMLEMMLLKMHLIVSSEDQKKISTTGTTQPQRPTKAATTMPVIPAQGIPVSKQSGSEEARTLSALSLNGVQNGSELELSKQDTPWQHCLKEIEKLHDPLLISLFSQGTDEKFDPQSKILEISFPKDLIFFKEWLENTKKLWQPLLDRFYGDETELRVQFNLVSTKDRPVKVASIPPVAPITPPASVHKVSSAVQKPLPAGKPLVPDAEKWQKAHLLTHLFPGTLTMLEKETA